MSEEKRGLDNTTIVFMIIVALFFDALQALLTVILMGWLVGFFAGLTFYLWFKMRGLNFTTPKRIGTFATTFIVEVIPFLSALPAWTLAIVILALDSKIKKVVAQVPGGQTAEKALANKSTNNQAAQIKHPGPIGRNTNYAPSANNSSG